MAEQTTVVAQEDNNQTAFADMIGSLEAPITDDEKAAIEAEKTAEAGKQTEASAEEKKEEKEEVKEPDPRDQELSQLRSLLRDQRKEQQILKAQIERMNKVQQGEVGDQTHTDPSELEKLAADIQTIKSERSTYFADLRSLMEVNPKFEDVNEVITDKRVSDIVELAASELKDKYGKDEVTMQLMIEKQLWQMPNPVKYLYELIKENHPDFRAKEAKVEEKAEAKEKHPQSRVTEEKKAVTTPTSVASVAGNAESHGGWTSARIDAMPETSLHTVPREIYNLYLAGELP